MREQRRSSRPYGFERAAESPVELLGVLRADERLVVVVVGSGHRPHLPDCTSAQPEAHDKLEGVVDEDGVVWRLRCTDHLSLVCFFGRSAHRRGAREHSATREEHKAKTFVFLRPRESWGERRARMGWEQSPPGADMLAPRASTRWGRRSSRVDAGCGRGGCGACERGERALPYC